MEDIKEFVEKVKLEADSFLNPGLFTKSGEEFINACITFLNNVGYTVVAPRPERFNVRSIDGLISHFFNQFEKYHPDKPRPMYSPDRDRGIARNFINNRIKATNKPRRLAMRDCAEIIATVFEHEKEFHFNMPIFFGMFNNSKFVWVIDKALQIMNKKLKEEVEAAQLRFEYEHDRIMAAKDIGFSDELFDKLLGEE